MVTLLQKMKEACMESKQNLPDRQNASLTDVIVNKETGDFRFIWDRKEEK